MKMSAAVSTPKGKEYGILLFPIPKSVSEVPGGWYSASY